MSEIQKLYDALTLFLARGSVTVSDEELADSFEEFIGGYCLYKRNTNTFINFGE